MSFKAHWLLLALLAGSGILLPVQAQLIKFEVTAQNVEACDVYGTYTTVAGCSSGHDITIQFGMKLDSGWTDYGNGNHFSGLFLSQAFIDGTSIGGFMDDGYDLPITWRNTLAKMDLSRCQGSGCAASSSISFWKMDSMIANLAPPVYYPEIGQGENFMLDIAADYDMFDSYLMDQEYDFSGPYEISGSYEFASAFRDCTLERQQHYPCQSAAGGKDSYEEISFILPSTSRLSVGWKDDITVDSPPTALLMMVLATLLACRRIGTY